MVLLAFHLCASRCVVVLSVLAGLTGRDAGPVALLDTAPLGETPLR
jgi:hypothetical protein